MLKYYLNIEQQRIGRYNGVSDSVLSTTLDVPNKYIELNEEQIARYNQNPNDLKYIIEGVATPPPTLSLDQQKEIKKAELLSNFTALQVIQDGYKFETKVFNFDENTITNVVQQKVRGDFNISLDEFKISTRFKEQITFNRIKFYEFGAGYSQVIGPLKEQLSNKKNQIDLATTEEELNSVNITDFNVKE